MTDILLSPEELKAIREREQAATDGPWAWANTCEKDYGANVGADVFGEDDEECLHPLSGDLTYRDDDYYVDQPIASLDHQRADLDARFIAHARTDIPRLLDTITALQQEVEDGRWRLTLAVSALENWGRHHLWCQVARDKWEGPEKPCICGLRDEIAKLRDPAAFQQEVEELRGQVQRFASAIAMTAPNEVFTADLVGLARRILATLEETKQ